MNVTRSFFVPAAVALLALGCDSRSQEPVSGARLFAENCAACHGETGEGDGPVADVLRVTMPNLRTLSERNDGAYPADDVRAYVEGRRMPAAHGDSYMPVWGSLFGGGEADVADAETEDGAQADAAQRIGALVDYVGQIQYR